MDKQRWHFSLALDQAAFECALAIVKEHRRSLDRWAALLLEKEALEGDVLAQLRSEVTAAAAVSKAA